MSKSPNKLIRFWQELKRRKTGKVIVAYAATAFILLQLADILTPALSLPSWTTTLVTLLLALGFPVGVIFSWVFDITPEGIKKTESLEVSESKEIVTKPARRIFRTSNIIIAALIIVVGILAYPKIFKRDTLEKLRSSGERISVAVMPFQNMTNDTTWDVWQDGVQNELINNLTNSEEFKVKQAESINDAIQSKGLTSYASITPSIANGISQKLDADIFIIGTLKHAGTTIRVNAQLIDSKSKEVFKSFQIEDVYKEERIFKLVDSLSGEIKNFLILSKLKQEQSHEVQTTISTNSPDAYRYFFHGRNTFRKENYSAARNFFSQALAIDSNFAVAIIYISTSYWNQGIYDQSKKWCTKAYEKKGQMPIIQKLYTNWLFASNFETPHEEIIYLSEILDIDDQLQMPYFLLGNAYNDFYQYDKAIPEYEKALEINKKLDMKPPWIYNYSDLGKAYHKTGKYKKEKRLYKKAEQDFPNDPVLIYRQAILAFTHRDSVTANKYVDKYLSVRRDNTDPEASIMTGLADLYSDGGILNKSEESYRKALSLQPENPDRLNNLAWFLIDKDRNIIEGLELIEKALELSPDSYYMLDTKGWGLYKQEKYQEALRFLQKSDSLKPIYNHEVYLHLEAAKKAVAGLKQ